MNKMFVILGIGPWHYAPAIIEVVECGYEVLEVIAEYVSRSLEEVAGHAERLALEKGLRYEAAIW